MAGAPHSADQSSSHYRKTPSVCVDRVDSDSPLGDRASSAPEESPKNRTIDNSRNVYIPVRLRCGSIAMCRPDVLVHSPMILDDINSDINDCIGLLPRSVHHLIRRTRIWVNLSHAYGSLTRPRFLTHTTAHHHEAWLLWARDRTDKTLGIEIYSAADYRRMRLHWNGCGLLLHEFCHLVHQLAVPDGLDNESIKEAYCLAKASGLYDGVRRRDWAGMERDYDLAYAMVDEKEFFSEMSTAYWSQYPDEALDKQDPCQILLCSPPFTEPSVIARIRNNAPGGSQPSSKRIAGGHMHCWFPRWFRTKPPHCNKFYPFTRGQLLHYDKSTYNFMHKLWDEIAKWDDPWRDGGTCDPNQECFCWRRRQHSEADSSQEKSEIASCCADTVDL